MPANSPLQLTLQYRTVPLYIMNNYRDTPSSMMLGLAKQMLHLLTLCLCDSYDHWQLFFSLQVMA